MGGRHVGIADFCSHPFIQPKTATPLWWRPWRCDIGLKTILIGVIVLLVVILGRAVVLLISIDFSQYKGLIAREAGDGVRAHHRGRLPAGAVPEAGRRGRGPEPSQLPRRLAPQMVPLKGLEVLVQFLPLLSHRINIDRLALAAAKFFWRPT